MSFKYKAGGVALALAAGVLMALAQAPTAPAPAARRGLRGGGGFSQPQPRDWNDNTGWTQIFDGQDFNGWTGNTTVFHVEDGSIVGESSPAHPSGTTNIWYTGSQPANFMLKMEAKLEGTGANGGIQFRSHTHPTARAPYNLFGYQEDMDYLNHYTGQLYEQGTGRGIIAWQGQVVLTEKGQKPRLLGTVASADEIKTWIKNDDWNQYEIIADGNTLTDMVNGHVTSVLVDNDPTYSAASGVIGMEIEGPGVVKISYRDIWLKNLP